MLAPLPATWSIVSVLAVWRVTHLLCEEDGPGDLLARLRRALGNGFFGRMLDCFYCLSLWVAAPAAWILGNNWADWILLWLGLSGGAILLERATTQTPSAPTPPPASWHVEPLPDHSDPPADSEEEHRHVLLR
ncbi:DUF1360 domain-containing protein [uncultured Paludibaculum sp.]|uniref:DUF1360 domain-containing protein n=1 Tax=uncultured Paludibaculum sp. TaxID=1765020 RepID=UPI002AAAC23F|nr:DUF1360 domain-containing protein [uncultured Paludibaculum sp.]